MIHRLTVVLLITAVASVTNAERQDRTTARMLWDLAIEAKGGRATLESVSNLLVTERTIYTRNTQIDPGYVRQRLYALPARLWTFVDHRPGMLGFGLSVLDLERPVLWRTDGPFPADQGTIDGVRNDLLHGQLIYLLETRFLRPEPTGARSGTVGRTAVDIVETGVPASDVRAEYYLDRKSHLPIRVVIFYTISTPPDAPVTPQVFKKEDRYTLGNYVNVGGLQMPTVATLEGPNKRNTTSYQINVDFDEQVFTTRPGPPRLNGWQRR
jgi:hypothetical protein